MKIRVIQALVTVALACTGAVAQPEPGTPFTYQGELKASGQPAAGPVDLRFTLYTLSSAGAQVGIPNDRLGVSLAAGRFVADLDFGPGAFGKDPRWLEIAVRSPAGSGSYVTLTPRQQVTAAPVAGFALKPWDMNGTAVTYGGGNVGIGTTSPTLASLVVTSQVGQTHAQFGSTAGLFAISNWPTLGFNVYFNNGWRYGSNGAAAGIGMEPGSGRMDFSIAPPGGGGAIASMTPRLSILESGNVGVGTQAPAARLDVAGNLRVQGSITTNAITRYKSIQAAAFLPDIVGRDSGGFENVSPSGVSGYGTGAGDFVAPLDLPHGATITEFRVYAVDSRGDLDMPVSLGRTSLTDASYINMATLFTSGSSSAVQNLGTSSISFPVVENNQFAYWIAADMNSFGGSLHRIVGCRITYTVTSPVP